MAVVEGTNAGFVTVAPASDPTDQKSNCDGRAIATKSTSPSGVGKVIEIGWWCDDATEEANFEVGIYDHDSGNDKPGNIVGNLSQTNAKGTTSGWKVVTGLNIPITSETIFWIAAQLDDTASNTSLNVHLGGTGRRSEKPSPQTTLTNPWGTSSETNYATPASIYAVWEAAPSGTNCKTNIGDTFKDVSEMKINIGDSWKAVSAVKQNISDAWKTVY